MFIRIYYVLKWSFNQSFYTDAFSKKLCNDYGFYPGFRFILKSKFINSPEQAVLTLFIVTVLVLSYIIRIFEIYYALHPQTDVFFNRKTEFFDDVYFIVVTLTTVGYGDIEPRTLPGKIIIMFTAIWGAVLISLVVVMVSKVFEMSENQEKALRQVDVSRKAAKAIAYAFKFYK